MNSDELSRHELTRGDASRCMDLFVKFVVPIDTDGTLVV